MKKVLELKNYRTVLFALATLSTLTGCANGQVDTPKSKKLILPPVIGYDNAFYDKLLGEAEIKQCPAHIEFGKDYILTRDRLRIAHTELKE